MLGQVVRCTVGITQPGSEMLSSDNDVQPEALSNEPHTMRDSTSKNHQNMLVNDLSKNGNGLSKMSCSFYRYLHRHTDPSPLHCQISLKKKTFSKQHCFIYKDLCFLT